MNQEVILADVDGVFTNDEAVPNQEAIALSGQLAARQIFSYATGRSAEWLEANIFPPLLEEYERHSPISSIVFAEYGTDLVSYDATQKKFVSRWRHTPVLGGMREQVIRDVSTIDGVFFDKTKKVLITIEARHDLPRERRKAGLKQAGDYMSRLVAEQSGIEWNETSYALDVSPIGYNKAHCARTLLERISFKPDHIHLIGDAPSDLGLAEPCLENNVPFTFHYVGEISRLNPEQIERCHVQFSSRRYGEGTVEVLKSLL